jgi:hypothetical protein
MNTFNTNYLGILNTTAAEVADMLIADMFNTLETSELPDYELDILVNACTIKSVENMITFTLGGWDFEDVTEHTQAEITFLKAVIDELN